MYINTLRVLDIVEKNETDNRNLELLLTRVVDALDQLNEKLDSLIALDGEILKIHERLQQKQAMKLFRQLMFKADARRRRNRVGARDRPQAVAAREQQPQGRRHVFRAAVTKKEGDATTAEIELAYWNSIANSSNPADFESYLLQYPNGRFAGLAQNKLKAAKSGPAARGESRAVDDSGGSYAPVASAPPPPPPSQPAKLAMAKPSGGVFSSGGFSFSEGEGTVKAAEFLSITCRDAIRNKRVRLDGRGSTPPGEARGSDVCRSPAARAPRRRCGSCRRLSPAPSGAKMPFKIRIGLDTLCHSKGRFLLALTAVWKLSYAMKGGFLLDPVRNAG